ncbi:MAG: sulfotransferase family protein [Dissulfurispiraceae bacterium]
MFIGYARSGHTLVGALIDAHPNAMISNELNALRYVRAGFNKWQIYSMILKKSEKFARKKGRAGPDYTYFVPNQWHGRYSRLIVIGDKKGDDSASSLATSDKLLEKLQKTINSEIKFIHVIRNPYDNISTISSRSKNDLRTSIERYFSRSEAVVKIKERVDPAAILDIRHESLIKNPREAVTQICDFLGLEPFEDYVKDCASIIYESPHKSRYKAEWTDELIALVAQKMSRYSYLEGYSFEK